ncbi:MAG: hypothetical protein AAFY42_11940 [Pseudomonadota bacterium]
MAQITPDTFDPLRQFVSVRLQQGVPIVDADWNEMDDTRRFEMRSHSNWYVGDGVPHGSQGFRIAALAPAVANDFVIETGVPAPPGGETSINVGLRHMGRCLVEGREVTIDADINFRSQPLHTSQGGSANLADRWGVPVIDEIPVLDGTVCIYLDVWDRLVRPDELPALVFPDIGTESCARIRQQWVVRARTGTTAPQSGDPDHISGHSYYALATISRIAATPEVFEGQITDERERQLQTPPSTLINDVLGTTPERYRRGLDRPAASLRTVLNALMRGELPSSDDQVIAPDAGGDFPARALSVEGTTAHYFWHSNRAGGTNQIFGTSWPVNDPARAADPPVQITNLGATTPALAILPTQPAPTLFVAYSSQDDVRFRTATSVSGLAAAAEDVIASQADRERHPIVVRSGQIVTVFWHWNGPGADDHIRFRRRQYDPTWAEGAAAWLEGDGQDISPIRPFSAIAEPGLMHAASDDAGRVWLAFWTAGNNIAVARLNTATGAIETWGDTELDSGGSDRQPYVLIEGSDRVWTFWRGGDGIYHSIHDVATDTWGAPSLIPGTDGPTGANQRPSAVIEPDGGIWLLWSRENAGDADVWAVRRNPATGGWGSPRQLTASPGENDYPYAIATSGQMRLFFRSNRDGQFDNYTKTIVTSI